MNEMCTVWMDEKVIDGWMCLDLWVCGCFKAKSRWLGIKA